MVQARRVVFPQNGAVLVQAEEEMAQNPRLVIRAQKSGAVLLTHTFTAEDDLLQPKADQAPSFNAFLRFQVFTAPCFGAPLIVAVAVAPGGSDHGFWAAVIGEAAGRLQVLTPADVQLNVQGGLFAGHLNQRYGCGLVVWNFVWDDGAHYDQHAYEITVYRWQNGRLVVQPKYETKRKYVNGTAALRELGIRAQDQRKQIAKVQRYVE
ncbi:MAG: hypothetical protein U0Y68_10890 [Blastocatellia bacterium]